MVKYLFAIYFEVLKDPLDLSRPAFGFPVPWYWHRFSNPCSQGTPVISMPQHSSDDDNLLQLLQNLQRTSLSHPLAHLRSHPIDVLPLLTQHSSLIRKRSSNALRDRDIVAYAFHVHGDWLALRDAVEVVDVAYDCGEICHERIEASVFEGRPLVKDVF